MINKENEIQYVCKDCKCRFPRSQVYWLESGEFICERCYGIDSIFRKKYRLSSLKLGYSAPGHLNDKGE
jgi:Zn finger protein HypA/HybF involved in hydrogenase expression